MPPFLLAGMAFAKRLNLSQIALIVAVGFALFYRVSLAAERRHADKLQSRVAELSTMVDNYAKQSKARQLESARRIERAERHSADVDRVAKRIEAAPLPGNCRTSAEVMGADL